MSVNDRDPSYDQQEPPQPVGVREASAVTSVATAPSSAGGSSSLVSAALANHTDLAAPLFGPMPTIAPAQHLLQAHHELPAPLVTQHSMYTLPSHHQGGVMVPAIQPGKPHSVYASGAAASEHALAQVQLQDMPHGLQAFAPRPQASHIPDMAVSMQPSLMQVHSKSHLGADVGYGSAGALGGPAHDLTLSASAGQRHPLQLGTTASTTPTSGSQVTSTSRSTNLPTPLSASSSVGGPTSAFSAPSVRPTQPSVSWNDARFAPAVTAASAWDGQAIVLPTIGDAAKRELLPTAQQHPDQEQERQKPNNPMEEHAKSSGSDSSDGNSFDDEDAGLVGVASSSSTSTPVVSSSQPHHAGKSGGGTSCHQCKCRKAIRGLYHCSMLINRRCRSNPGKRKCRKKYCGRCLTKFYGERSPAPAERDSWICPSCRRVCTCAACKRYTGGSRANKEHRAPAVHAVVTAMPVVPASVSMHRQAQTNPALPAGMGDAPILIHPPHHQLFGFHGAAAATSFVSRPTPPHGPVPPPPPFHPGMQPSAAFMAPLAQHAQQHVAGAGRAPPPPQFIGAPAIPMDDMHALQAQRAQQQHLRVTEAYATMPGGVDHHGTLMAANPVANPQAQYAPLTAASAAAFVHGAAQPGVPHEMYITNYDRGAAGIAAMAAMDPRSAYRIQAAQVMQPNQQPTNFTRWAMPGDASMFRGLQKPWSSP